MDLYKIFTIIIRLFSPINYWLYLITYKQLVNGWQPKIYFSQENGSNNEI